MIHTFLKAKHWQLFILTFGVMLIFQFFMMGKIFSNIEGGNNPDPMAMFSLMKYFPIVMIICMGTFFGWFWSIGVGLQHLIPEEHRLNIKKFKAFLLIPLVYIIFFMLFITMAFTLGGFNPGSFFLVIIPLHLFSMFCIFYCLYFVAKTIKTAELQKKVTFGDFAGEFFMIWFYPIGIWIIQPRINKLINTESNL